MSRRSVSLTRRLGDSASFPFAGALRSKSRSSPVLSICLVLVGGCLLIGYVYSGPGNFKSVKDVNKVTGDYCCTSEVQRLKEEEIEAWGVKPYDIEDADPHCKNAVDYLSPKYLNKTVPELARVASDGLVLFAGYLGQQRAKVTELSKFGRPAKMRSSSWRIRFFFQANLEENEGASKKFEQAASKRSYSPNCQVFHLMPLP